MTQMRAGSDEGLGGGWKPNLRGNCFKLHSEGEQKGMVRRGSVFLFLFEDDMTDSVKIQKSQQKPIETNK